MLIGIDLGTTNSAASYWKDGEARLIPNALGDYLTPSVVSLDDDGRLLTGLAARERKAVRPDQTQSVFKRHMGNKIQLILGEKVFQPEELSALVLRQLKEDAEIHLGQPVNEAIITVPAYFNDRQRKATKRAGELAGFKVRRLINEPTAAALAYGIIDRDDKEPYLVFDLGGGTFDVSIVEVFDGIIEVRATAGDNRLGGEDFNDALIGLARRKLDLTGFVHASFLQEKLKLAAEHAKRHLSQSKSADFEFVSKDRQFKTLITEDEFEGAAQPLLERLRSPVLRSLRDASIAVKDISELILVGGSTRMPIVRRAIAKMLGRFPNALIDPDHAVALGAGVSCGLLTRDADLKEVRLTDVSPFTLGIKSHEQDRNRCYRPIYVPLIERSTVLPSSRSHTFSTMHPNQTVVIFEIYQGESRQVDENLKLGEIEIQVPRKPELVQIECRFTYDVSGLLEVDLYVPETNLTRQLVIVDREDGVNEDELQKRRDVLASLKVHPRENAENMALLARGEKCYELLLGVQREILGKVLRDFEAVLERQNPEEIKQERKALTEWLDNLEGERFL